MPDANNGRFTIEEQTVCFKGVTDTIDNGDLAAAVLHTLGTDLQVSIGGITMPLGAWLEPDGYEDDWADKLDCTREDVEARVADLLTDA
jgi:hypothetical protein